MRNPSRRRRDGFVIIRSVSALLSNLSSLLALFPDPGALTATVAEEIQLGATDTAGLIHFNGINVRRIKREGSFHTYTIRDLTNCKSAGMASSLAFDHIAAEALDTLFTAF